MSEDAPRGLYVETDFLLALIKDDDWLRERAESIYEARHGLWTHRDTLVELMALARRRSIYTYIAV